MQRTGGANHVLSLPRVQRRFSHCRYQVHQRSSRRQMCFRGDLVCGVHRPTLWDGSRERCLGLLRGHRRDEAPVSVVRDLLRDTENFEPILPNLWPRGNSPEFPYLKVDHKPQVWYNWLESVSSAGRGPTEFQQPNRVEN